jgi:serine protease Do
MEPKDSNAKQVITPKSRPAEQVGRVLSFKSAVVGAVVIALVTALLTGGVVAAAFLVGDRMFGNNSLEQQRQVVSQEGEVIADIAQRVGPSVVSITTEQQSRSINRFSFLPQESTRNAAGTGMIVDPNGLILTNKHVVPEGTSDVIITMADGTTYDDVDIVGRDPLNDLAILKVKNPKNFKAVALGDSDRVRTGEKVVAIGNALGQFQNSVTSGIISGMGRPVEAGDEDGTMSEQLSNLFQTDAAINSGNSGGPLVNLSGEVIGINTAIAADAENIGFSIPSNEARAVVDSAKTTGKVSRPYIGVRYTSLTPDIAKELNLNVTSGAYIGTDEGSVVSGSPAAIAGLKGGDVITKVNDVAVNEKVSLGSAVGRFKVGDSVTLTVVREGKEQKITLKLAEAPSS